MPALQTAKHSNTSAFTNKSPKSVISRVDTVGYPGTKPGYAGPILGYIPEYCQRMYLTNHNLEKLRPIFTTR